MSMEQIVFELVKDRVCAPIIVEQEEYEGVRRIAKKSAQDISLVTSIEPRILEEIPEACQNVVLFATIGRSRLLERLEHEGKLSLADVRDKREVYGIQFVDEPWEGVKRALVIFGSEKRGTIYGIFRLSEQIGVSPLVFWGDAKPVHQKEIILNQEIVCISREPSVRYRGFFINDEWPCFGNWTRGRYGGFSANMYEHVFELLLRLRGNYLWPAMWSSSFALDGPGEENAKLADMYGVIMGNSHHEPCLRASEEWDIYRGEDTPYGSEWNYVTNKEGLLNYWEDGLKRSSRYENIVTVGMRGERDSMMEGTKTLSDNIEVLKDIISNQMECIDRHEIRKMPRLLAIYKEVEQYFYGDATTPGLREWDGLDSIILMLCEDNYGNMRTLPDKTMRERKSGWGMYYHLDYHGSPVSYEWVNSTPLTKIWEQMTECYEYGVREVWMVNVGDLKGNEFPLSYFMDLAYDFNSWGTDVLDSTEIYTKCWLERQFHGQLTMEQLAMLHSLLTEGIRLTSLRKPESLHSQVYHPAHFHEADRILEATEKVRTGLNQLKQNMKAVSQSGFESMIYYPLMESMNLIQMHIYAGKNEHYARQGKKIANRYGELVTQTIQKDKELAEKFAELFDGKWKGMELGRHVGFQKWNEDGCRYPLRMQVEPFDRPRLMVSRSDRETVYVKNYGTPEQIIIRDFLSPECDCVEIEVANDGVGSLHCQVRAEGCSWLSMNWSEKEVEEQEVLRLSCLPDELPAEEERQVILLSDGDAQVQLIVYGQKKEIEELPTNTFYERDGIIAILPQHFQSLKVGRKKEPGKTSDPVAEYKILNQFGKTGFGLKAFPVTEQFSLGEGPAAVYGVAVEHAGNYMLEVWSAPSNPLEASGRLSFGIGLNDEPLKEIPTVSETYQGGVPENEEWCQGVLNQVHISKSLITLKRGLNQITIYAMDAGFVLEELVIYREDLRLPDSYLGPQESWHTSSLFDKSQ